MSEDLSRLVDEMGLIVRSNAMPIAVYVIGMTCFWMLIDYYYWYSNIANLLGVLLDFALIYFVMAFILWSSGYDRPNPPRKMLGLFGLSMLIGLGVVIGLVFFILPGIYLMMKWLPAYGYYLSRDTNIADSLDWSWQSTSSLRGALLLILALTLVPAAFAIWLGLIEYWPLGLTDLTGSFVMNFIGSVSYIAITVLGLASLNILDARDHNPA